MKEKLNGIGVAAAFSLMELLVTVAAIGILAVLVLACFKSAALVIKRTQCLNNMHQIGVATLAYSGDHDGYFPINENYAWDVPLVDYLNAAGPKVNPVLKCPSDIRPLLIGGNFARSYCFNALLPQKTLGLAEPAQVIMLAEWYTGGGGTPGGAKENYQYGANYDIVEYRVGLIPSNKGMNGYHETQSNFIFADGHAESIDPRQTLGDKSMWANTLK